MAFHQVSLKNVNGSSGRRSPGHQHQHQAGRSSPTYAKKTKYLCINNNNNNNNNVTVSASTSCCSSHCDTQQSIGKRHVESSQTLASTSTSHSSLSTFLEQRSTLVKTGLFLTCVALYWNSLPGEFVFDDVTAIRDNKDLRPHVPVRNLFRNDFWGTPMNREQSHKSYRPLTVLTFRWNFAVGGLDPVGYHLVNVVLHGVVSVLYFDVCRKVASSAVSLTSSLLFALHPVRKTF